MTITTSQVLNLLAKASKLNIQYSVEEVNHFCYDIKMIYNWKKSSKYDYRYLFIPNERETDFVNDKNSGYYSFDELNDFLDVRIKEQEEREEKERKRKALLERLTVEERELLGI